MGGGGGGRSESVCDRERGEGEESVHIKPTH